MINEDKNLLLIPGEDPIPVTKRHVWRFVEKNLDSRGNDDHLCWTTVHSGSQGQGIIKGSFLDYKVKDILVA